MRAPLDVLKFGSSVLAHDRDLPAAVHEIYRSVRRGRRVVAVVSAIGGTTDALLEQARGWSEPARDEPAPGPLALLLGTGERAAAALLALALDRAGVPAIALDAHRVGIRTEGRPLDAQPIALEPEAIRRALGRAPVVVVPGFVGTDRADGHTTLLGRGGSDLTAVFLATTLGADRCVLLKDVDGVYTHDPAAAPDRAHRYADLTWERALEVATVLVQPKAVELARAARRTIEVTAIGCERSTIIGPGPCRLAPPAARAAPLRVALLGLGHVGGGVYARLRELPEHFEITGALVRDRSRPRSCPRVPEMFDLDPDHLVDDPRTLLARPCDVVVELLGGVDPALDLIERSLRCGRAVVTANKAVIATHGPALDALAASHGARLLDGGCVGGAAPVLEHVEALAGAIAGFEGVLSGTANFVLDAIAHGAAPDDAVRRAQELGLAEADPSLDLSGADAAQKTAILCRRAFGVDVDPGDIPTEGIFSRCGDDTHPPGDRGVRIRLVAEARPEPGGGVTARVRRRVLPTSDPLARVHGADNAIRFDLTDGTSLLVKGTGAGRWPTTEAVLGDLLALRRTARPRRTPLEVA